MNSFIIAIAVSLPLAVQAAPTPAASTPPVGPQPVASVSRTWPPASEARPGRLWELWPDARNNNDGRPLVVDGWLWMLQRPDLELVRVELATMKTEHIALPKPATPLETEAFENLRIVHVSKEYLMITVLGDYLPWRLLILDFTTKKWQRLAGIPPMDVMIGRTSYVGHYGKFFYTAYRDPGEVGATGRLRFTLPDGKVELLTNSGSKQSPNLPRVAADGAFYILDDGRLGIGGKTPMLRDDATGEWKTVTKKEFAAAIPREPHLDPYPPQVGIISKAEPNSRGDGESLTKFFAANPGATHALCLGFADGRPSQYFPVKFPAWKQVKISAVQGGLLFYNAAWTESIAFATNAELGLSVKLPGQ